jgi:heat shock protein HslJ
MSLALPRLRLALQFIGAATILAAVFAFGMWLTWPEFPYNPSSFPIERQFFAISLNNEPMQVSEAPKLATLEVRGRLTFRHRVGGNSLCNQWGGSITFLPGKRMTWGSVFSNALSCTSAAILNPLEEKFLRALPRTTRWRREDDTLILENDTDILRFQLAPL